MEQEKTLLERLKETGMGTLLYSPALGTVTLVGIDLSKHKPIIVSRYGELFYFTKHGKLCTDNDGPVMLFTDTDDWMSEETQIEKEDMECGTPIMCSEDGINWQCGIYKGYGLVSQGGFETYMPRYIVSVEEFKPTGPHWIPDSKFDYGKKGTPI